MPLENTQHKVAEVLNLELCHSLAPHNTIRQQRSAGLITLGQSRTASTPARQMSRPSLDVEVFELDKRELDPVAMEFSLNVQPD